MFQASDYTGLLHQLEQFFADASSKQEIAKPCPPQVLRDRLSLELPVEGKALADLQADIQRYLTYAVKTAHPAYFNQLWGGFNAACFAGDMLASATNTSMYTYEVAPVATLIEQTLIAKAARLIGFERAEGQFTTGGSNGNFMAMAIARHKAAPNLKQTGMTGGPRLIAFVSEEAHYSFDKAAHLLGLGTDQLWKVPADEKGKMNVAALAAAIARAREADARPFFVAGTAGTTVRGAYDPLEEIAAIARREKLWFHVDGAWGASVLLSRAHRHLMAGVEKANSVVWDAHKMMGLTLTCSMLLIEQPGQMLETFSTRGSDYLFHDDPVRDRPPHDRPETPQNPPSNSPTDLGPIDLGPSTMHCGRRVDALKLWLAWQHLGDRGWEALIDRYFDLAARTETLIENCDRLEMLAGRESLNLCFQYRPEEPLSQNSLDDLTLKVRTALWEKGLAMVNYAQINGRTGFRLVICNNQTRLEDIEIFLKDLVAIARSLAAST